MRNEKRSVTNKEKNAENKSNKISISNPMMIEETRSKEREKERTNYGNNAERDDSRGGVNGESLRAEEASSARAREARWPRKKLVARRE